MNILRSKVLRNRYNSAVPNKNPGWNIIRIGWRFNLRLPVLRLTSSRINRGRSYLKDTLDYIPLGKIYRKIKISYLTYTSAHCHCTIARYLQKKKIEEKNIFTPKSLLVQ